MDNLTHTLAGVAMANAFFRRRIGVEAIPILAAASNMPDIDALVLLTHDPLAVTMRRTFGHSIFLAPVWTFALALAARKLCPRLSWRAALGLSALGIGVHLLLDMVNSFGVLLLWPLSNARPELSILFIVDLILIGLLAAPLLSAWVGRMKPFQEKIWRLSIMMAVVYILFCWGNRRWALRAMETSGTNPGAGSWTYAFPEPFGPHRWRIVVREGRLYRLYLAHSLTGAVEPRGKLATRIGTPDVEAARATPQARRIESFFKAPVWDSEPATTGGTLVRVYDLRFKSLVLERGGKHFEYRFLIRPGSAPEPI